MKLFEYQAKELFKEAGIHVPESVLIEDRSQVKDAVLKTGLPCVLKAQVLRGGRGKAGLIRFVGTLEEAEKEAVRLFNADIPVHKLLMEEALDIARELYVSVTIDPVTGSDLIVASGAGGMDIEEIAVKAPEKLIKEKVDAFKGLNTFQTRNIAFQLDVEQDKVSEMIKIVASVYSLFKKIDAELVEINPLVITGDGRLVAADGKISIDDHSLFRQKNFGISRSHFDSDLEFEAAVAGFPYLRFDGDIGIMCAGAGLTNTVYDLIHYYGGKPANYLEFGGPNYTRTVEAMSIALKNKPKVLLIVTFGTIARADVIARGIEEAIEKLKPDIPIVTAIRGTGEEEANEILKRMGLHPLADTEEAVKTAIALAAKGGEK
ncbi:MAG: acetate--CoA ligase family protein [Firmicutes bacterium]|nr:acetate--CoA ligase family protein [Bacillota bacterium]